VGYDLRGLTGVIRRLSPVLCRMGIHLDIREKRRVTPKVVEVECGLCGKRWMRPTHDER
jgi:hypothetical protein